MQASNGWLVAIMVVSALIIIGSVFYVGSQIPEQQTIDVPTAAEIAAQITIPEVDNSLNQEIWNSVYEDEVEDLEDDAIDACEDEFDIDDIEDLFDKYADIDFVKEFEDEREIDILDLGLDDEDDRSVLIKGVTKWEVDNEYEIVYGLCKVTSDDGDLEADLSYWL